MKKTKFKPKKVEKKKVKKVPAKPEPTPAETPKDKLTIEDVKALTASIQKYAPTPVFYGSCALREIPEGTPFRRIYTVEEVAMLLQNNIIDKAQAQEFLAIPPKAITEKHAVQIQVIGEKGSIGLLHLYADGSALFVPTVKKSVHSFGDTGLKFTIEPFSMEIEPIHVKKTLDEEQHADVDEDEDANVVE